MITPTTVLALASLTFAAVSAQAAPDVYCLRIVKSYTSGSTLYVEYDQLGYQQPVTVTFNNADVRRKCRDLTRYMRGNIIEGWRRECKLNAGVHGNFMVKAASGNIYGRNYDKKLIQGGSRSYWSCV